MGSAQLIFGADWIAMEEIGWFSLKLLSMVIADFQRVDEDKGIV